MLSNHIAVFEKALKLYQQKNFEQARKLITDYKKYIEYDLFQHDDRRSVKIISVSVVIVSFGAKQGVLECLDSLSKQKDQDFEIILVDNGGNEKKSERLKDYSVLHLCPPINLLPSEGRNIGAYFARGKYLVFLDDDALVHPNYITSIKTAWRSFNFLALRGRILPKSSSGNNSFTGHYDFGKYPMPAILMTEGNMVIKKDVFSAVGGFDPLIFGGEGTELSYRCKKKFPKKDIYYWPEMVIYHDFPSGRNLVEKKKRHSLTAAYFNYLAPEMNDLPEAYGRWYDSRPMGAVVYDNRSKLRKMISYAQEKYIGLKNMF